MKLRELIGRYNILGQFLVLVLTLSSFALYNYVSQKRVFLQQLQVDTDNIVEAVRSSINKFQTIKSTMSLQELVENISLNLEIFEFRYLDRDGTILNSMFKDEIGRKFARPGFDPTKIGRDAMGHIYLDVRDYTSVMAISQPVYLNDEVVGIIDLAVDISEYDDAPKEIRDVALRQMRMGINNLIHAIDGSITTSLKVFHTVDYYDFLSNYIRSSRNLLQIAIISAQGIVEVSSDLQLVGTKLDTEEEMKPGQVLLRQEKPIYRVVTSLDPKLSSDKHLYLLIDATPYVANEHKLLLTAIGTSTLAIFFSILIAYSIYRINVERARQENIRLEMTVRERTAEIERLSQTDGLTGLFNRRHLEEVMEAEFKRAVRYVHDLSIMIFDLDHFKQINDRYGHLGGDAVLRNIGTLLRNHLRETDFAGRFGGEEFVVVLPESGLAVARKVAEDLRQLIEDVPILFEGQRIPVTTSIGISALRDDLTELSILLQEADTALYRSKENGRNQVSCYEPAPRG